MMEKIDLTSYSYKNIGIIVTCFLNMLLQSKREWNMIAFVMKM